jgi:hypothetical protein
MIVGHWPFFWEEWDEEDSSVHTRFGFVGRVSGQVDEYQQNVIYSVQKYLDIFVSTGIF